MTTLNEIEIKNILGYELILLKIEDFKKYYEENIAFFTDYSEKQFLKAAGIPALYFLEQPQEVKETLLQTQLDIIEEGKLAKKYIILLKKDNSIINCCRTKYNSYKNIYERTKLDDESRLILVRNFIREGFINTFIPFNDLIKGEYNLGIFVDIPILCNKLPKIHKGFYFIPKNSDEQYKCMYLETQEIDFNNYQNLDLFITDSLTELENIKEENVIEKLKDKLLLRELEEILIKLSEAKIIPSKYVKGIIKYADKNKIILPNIFSLIDLLLKYDAVFKGYKNINRFRLLKDTLLKIIGKEQLVNNS